MKESVNNYIVSSAGWEVLIDDISPYSAALSGVLHSLSRFGKNMVISTTVMVQTESDFKEENITNAEFYASHNIFADLGLKDISECFRKLCNET